MKIRSFRLPPGWENPADRQGTYGARRTGKDI